MLGTKRKGRQIEESQMAAISRKSIVLARAAKSGEVLTLQHFRLQRPGSGLDSSFMEKLLGMVLRKDLPAGYQLKWVDLEEPI